VYVFVPITEHDAVSSGAELACFSTSDDIPLSVDDLYLFEVNTLKKKKVHKGKGDDLQMRMDLPYGADPLLHRSVCEPFTSRAYITTKSHAPHTQMQSQSRARAHTHTHRQINTASDLDAFG
jgi:hypothetical protein